MLVDLPSYPFNHTRKYWVESRISKNFRFRQTASHELLGTPVADWNPLDARWRNIIRLSQRQWIQDHKVHDTNTYPAAGILVMAIDAIKQVEDAVGRTARGFRFRDVEIKKALIISSSEIEVQFHLRPPKDRSHNFLQWNEFKLYACEANNWDEVSSGLIAIEHEAHTIDEAFELNLHGSTCSHAVAQKEFYQRFKSVGLVYGSSFQSLREIRHNTNNEATAYVNIDAWKDVLPDSQYQHVQPYTIHPAALDAIFQSAFAALSEIKPLPIFVPTRFRNL